MYEKMNDRAKGNHFGKILKQEIDKMAALQPGSDAPDFYLTAIDGSELSLKDCLGSYVLIYHWGLSSGSLKIDNEVVDLHHKYKDKLKIIGITDNIDMVKDAYGNTTPEDEILPIPLKLTLENMLAHPWFEVEKKEHNKKIEEDYAFSGIPFFVLISPEGKIIARDPQKAFYKAQSTMKKELKSE